MTWDKIKIRAKGMELTIDDADLRFSMVETNYDSDGDRESEPYSIKDLIDNAESFRGKCDLKIQTQWEEYNKNIRRVQAVCDKVKKENEDLTKKLKELMLKSQ